MYDTLILGSGYFSLGYASTHENTLIVEETQLADPHFFGNLRGYGKEVERPKTKGAAALYDLLLSENMVSRQGIAVNELEPALCRFIAGNKPEILLGTFCTELKRIDGGYEAELCNNEGLSRVFAKKVIDLRRPAGRRMNLLIVLSDGKEPNIEGLKPAFGEEYRVVEYMGDTDDVNDLKNAFVESYYGELMRVGAKIVCASYRSFDEACTEEYVNELGVLCIDENAEEDIFAAYGKGELFV